MPAHVTDESYIRKARGRREFEEVIQPAAYVWRSFKKVACPLPVILRLTLFPGSPGPSRPEPPEETVSQETRHRARSHLARPAPARNRK